YLADGDQTKFSDARIRPGMFMPAWASRIILRAVRIDAHRICEITAGDAVAEGIPDYENCPPERVSASHATDGHRMRLSPEEIVGRFSVLWEDTNGAGSWKRNDYVRVIEFVVEWNGLKA